MDSTPLPCTLLCLCFNSTIRMHAGSGPLQQPITHFVSSGGGGSGAQQLDAFFRRLAATKEEDLPVSIGRVQLSLLLAPQQQQQQQWRLASAGDVNSNADGAGSGPGSEAAAAAADAPVEVVREDWLVCNQLGGQTARDLALKTWREDKVKMIPWVGVATQLGSHAVGIGNSSRPSRRSLSCRTSTAGRAFCFLPLPADTHLPVHINGYFELSSNRCDMNAGYVRGVTCAVYLQLGARSGSACEVAERFCSQVVTAAATTQPAQTHSPSLWLDLPCLCSSGNIPHGAAVLSSCLHLPPLPLAWHWTCWLLLKRALISCAADACTALLMIICCTHGVYLVDFGPLLHVISLHLVKF